MASNTRSTRRTAAAGPSSLTAATKAATTTTTTTMETSAMSAKSEVSAEDIASLTNIERLVLAQAVYEFGSNSWVSVAKLLSKHPVLSRPKSFFTPQSCLAMYVHFMEEAGLQRSEANNAAHAPGNLALAQRFYAQRLVELRGQIVNQEAEFKRTVAEIDEIRAGKWDDKIRTKLSGIGNFPSAQPSVEEVISETKNDGMADTVDEHDLSLVQIIFDDAAVVQPPDVIAADEDEDETAELEVSEDEPIVEEEEDDQEAEGEEEEQEEQDEQVAKEEEEEDNVEEEQSSVMEGVEEHEAVTAVTDAPDGALLPESEQVLDDPGVEMQEDEPIPAIPVPAETADDVIMVDETSPRDVSEPAPQASPSPDAEGEEVEGEDVTPKLEERDEVLYQSGEEAASPSHQDKLKATDSDATPVGSPQDRKRSREDSETVDEDEQGAGSSRRRRAGDPVVNKRFQAVITMLHSQISQHRNGNIFHNPIKDSEAPDYHDIIKRPMDLKTIKQRIKDGLITTSSEFQREVYLMFANAIMYNRPGSDIFNMAEEMMVESEAQINTFRQTEGFVRKR